MLRPSLQRLLLGGAGCAIAAHAPLAAIAAAGGAGRLLQRCWAGFSTQAQQQQQQQQPPPLLQDLTPEQQQHLNVLQFLVRRPLDTARNAAMLAGLAAGYRDLFVVMDLLHKKDVLGIPHPLLDEPPAASASSSSSSSSMQQDGQQQQQEKGDGAAEGASQANRTQLFYPQRDFTLLPDELPPEGGWLRNHLSDQYMTRITAYAQLLPNHLEVSYQTSTQICLWPPMEAFYPALFDIDGMLRHLQPGFKRRRTKRASNARRVRCRLGWQRRKPYHKQPGLLAG